MREFKRPAPTRKPVYVDTWISKEQGEGGLVLTDGDGAIVRVVRLSGGMMKVVARELEEVAGEIGG